MTADDLVDASRLVGRVVRGGAYSNVLLAREPRPAVRALVYGVLRRLFRIDASLEAAAGRPLQRLDSSLVDLLRVAAVGLEGERPTAVVVNTAVEAARRVAPRAGGLVNAVLRRLAETGLVAGHDPELRLGVPAWLYDRISDCWGVLESDAFWEASNTPGPIGVRVRPGGRTPPEAEPVPGIRGAALIRRPPIPEGVVVQDPASVAVGLAVDPGRGELVLEVGAAPGQKSLHLLDMGARVVGIDVHPRRSRTAARQVPQARFVVADGTRPPFPSELFPKVLVDAPCTGLGTLRRRPELRYRVTPEEVQRLARLQRLLVEASLRLVAPGGRLVYSVCTVTPEETVQVVEGLGFVAPEGLPGRRWGDGLLLGPHLTGTDGMFVAVWNRSTLSSR